MFWVLPSCYNPPSDSIQVRHQNFKGMRRRIRQHHSLHPHGFCTSIFPRRQFWSRGTSNNKPWTVSHLRISSGISWYCDMTVTRQRQIRSCGTPNIKLNPRTVPHFRNCRVVSRICLPRSTVITEYNKLKLLINWNITKLLSTFEVPLQMSSASRHYAQ